MLKSQIIITTHLLSHWFPFDTHNSCNLLWCRCHKFFEDGQRQIVPEVQLLNILRKWFLSSELLFHDIPKMLHVINIQWVRWQDICMPLETLQHNFSCVTWSIILFEYFIPNEENKHHERVQLVCSDVEIVWTFYGVFFLNNALSDDHENVSQTIAPHPLAYL